MIKNYTLFVFLFASVTLNAQNINIPDANFKKALVDNTAINTNSDTEISESEAAAYTGEIYVLYKNISDLSGIEYFTNITSLSCYQNKLTSIDVSKNTALTQLDCGSNQLTQLDVSKNMALTELWCSSNQLTTLDVSNNNSINHFMFVLSLYNQIKYMLYMY